jgi:hypothetical protein
MRRGYNNGFVFENGELIGMTLGADYCAEHEWGIKTTRSVFGCDDNAVGIDRYRITQLPARFAWLETARKNKAGFIFDRYELPSTYDGLVKVMRSYPKEKHKENEFESAWSDGDFGVLSTDKSAIKHLRTIYEAIVNKNAIIMLGGGGVFQNAGLVIAIADKIPEATKTMWKEEHEAKIALTAEFKATGIEEKLRAAGKRWFALSPSIFPNGFRNEHHNISERVMLVFLNPQEQQKHNYGWFTIQELEQWANNEGPVFQTNRPPKHKYG